MTSASAPIPIPNRALLAVTGADALVLLQRLTSNDLSRLETSDGGIYTLLLTPQGRYLHDFFVFRSDDAFYLDVPADQAEALILALKKYNLRGDASFMQQTGWQASLVSDKGALSFRDPRHESLGWRVWQQGLVTGDSTAYQNCRVALGIVEPSTEMKPGDSLPMEFALDRLNAISFTKGCYIGQEMTARMHNRDLTKHTIVVKPHAEPGDIVLTESDGLVLVQMRRV